MDPSLGLDGMGQIIFEIEPGEVGKSGRRKPLRGVPPDREVTVSHKKFETLGDLSNLTEHNQCRLMSRKSQRKLCNRAHTNIWRSGFVEGFDVPRPPPARFSNSKAICLIPVKPKLKSTRNHLKSSFLRS